MIGGLPSNRILHMRLSLPVLYEASVKKKGERNFKHRRYVALREFEIEEVDPRDAPVALRGFALEHPAFGEWKGEGYSHWFEGRHWLPERNEAGGISTPREWSADMLRSETSKFMESFAESARKAPDLWMARRGNITQLDRDEVREIEFSNLEAEAERLRLGLDAVRVVGNTVVHQAHTPLYHVWRHNDAIRTELRFGFPYSKEVDVFQVTRRDDMLAYAEEIRGDARYALDPGPEPEVLMPWAFEFPDEERSLIQHAQHCITTMESILNKLDERQGIAWFRLRGACNRAVNDADGRHSEVLAEAMQEVFDSIPPTDWTKLHAPDICDKARMTTEKALMRWNMRPFEVEEDEGVRPSP